MPRVCSAYKGCPVETCKHKAPHECEEKGMHRFDTCSTSKITSSCLEIKDGKIPVVGRKKCEQCGHSERVEAWEVVS